MLRLLCARDWQVRGVREMWNTLREELREMAWLASVIGGLSMLGVGIAVALAAA
jgi:hypothetical protein